MRDYGKVAPSFWTRGTGKRLRGKPDAQVLALYLATCPAANVIGIFYVPLATMAHETGLSPERVGAAMTLLRDLDFAIYDDDTETVWIPTLATYQVAESLEPGDKRRIGLVRAELKRLGKHPFLRLFWERYGAAYNLGPCPSAPMAAIEPECTEGQSSSIDQEQKQKQEQEQKQKQRQVVAGATHPSVLVVQEPETAPGKPRRTRAGTAMTPWPEGFVVSPAIARMCRDEDLPNPYDVIRDFESSARAKGYRYADWESAFRKWMRSAITRRDYPVWEPESRTSLAAPDAHGPPAIPTPEQMAMLQRALAPSTEPLFAGGGRGADASPGDATGSPARPDRSSAVSGRQTSEPRSGGILAQTGRVSTTPHVDGGGTR